MVSNSSNAQDWAYDFDCDQSLEDILDAFNRVGPWNWTLRENYIQGNYLNSRPVDDVHIKLNAYPQAFISGPRAAGYLALIRTASDDAAFREGFDRTMLGLLEKIDARDIVAIEPYD